MATDEQKIVFSQVAPRYHAALMALGVTHQERAARLGVSVRQVIAYLQGKAMPRAQVLKRVPALDAAFTDDLAPILAHVQRRDDERQALAALADQAA